MSHSINKTKTLSKIKHYFDTYNNQKGFESYTDETFINDYLYGLGIAVDKSKYQFAQGYDLFLQELKIFIDDEIKNNGPHKPKSKFKG